MTPGTSTYALIDCVRALRLLARIVGDRPDDALQWYVTLDERLLPDDENHPCLVIDSVIDLTPLEADLVRRMIADDLEVEPRPLRFENDAQVDAALDVIADALADADPEPDA